MTRSPDFRWRPGPCTTSSSPSEPSVAPPPPPPPSSLPHAPAPAPVLPQGPTVPGETGPGLSAPATELKEERLLPSGSSPRLERRAPPGSSRREESASRPAARPPTVYAPVSFYLWTGCGDETGRDASRLRVSFPLVKSLNPAPSPPLCRMVWSRIPAPSPFPAGRLRRRLPHQRLRARLRQRPGPHRHGRVRPPARPPGSPPPSRVDSAPLSLGNVTRQSLSLGNRNRFRPVVTRHS